MPINICLKGNDTLFKWLRVTFTIYLYNISIVFFKRCENYDEFLRLQ